MLAVGQTWLTPILLFALAPGSQFSAGILPLGIKDFHFPVFLAASCSPLSCTGMWVLEEKWLRGVEGQLFLSSLASHLRKESWSTSIYRESGGGLKDGKRWSRERETAPWAWHSRLTSRLLTGERETTILKHLLFLLFSYYIQLNQLLTITSQWSNNGKQWTSWGQGLLNKEGSRESEGQRFLGFLSV